MKFYGKIPDILVLITGHFGLFKTPTLRLGEASTIQTPSQTQRLRKAKTNFKSVRKTITTHRKRNIYFELIKDVVISMITKQSMPMSKKVTVPCRLKI